MSESDTDEQSRELLDKLAERLKQAYVNERKKLEITEVELNRAKIMMVGADGQLQRVPILSEH